MLIFKVVTGILHLEKWCNTIYLSIYLSNTEMSKHFLCLVIKKLQDCLILTLFIKKLLLIVL